MNEIVIGTTNVSIKEYNSQRVVTFKDIDAVHSRPDGTARRNFNRNKEHFIEGEDYFVRNSYEAKKEYNATAPNGLILLTESGYLMLAKSFTDDKAWDVQRALVKSYFKFREVSPICPTPEEKPYNYFDKFYKGEPVISLNDFSFFTGATRYRAYGMLMRCGKPETDYYTLEGSALADFKQENPKFPKAAVRWFIVITKSGFDKLIELMGFKTEAPKIFIEEKNQVCTAAVSKPSVDDYITALNVIRKIRNTAAEFMEDDIQKGKTFMIDSYTKDIEACKRITKLLGINVATGCR